MAWRLASAIIVLGILAGAGAAVVVATDNPRFCIVCHEMTPHYNAWANGPHARVWCVDCHVGSSPQDRVAHKFIALQEVRVHLTRVPRFPLPTPPEVPQERCTRCHSALPASTNVGFPHSRHTFKKCVDCHQEAGHAVTLAQLDSAGVLSPEAASKAKPPVKPRIGAGANIRGHPLVVCCICHRLAEIPCSRCHGSRYAKRP